MEKRIVRLEDDLWRIRTEKGELPEAEREELIKYFGEFKLAHRFVNNCVCIAGLVDRDSVFERLEHFIQGRRLGRPQTQYMQFLPYFHYKRSVNTA